MEAARAGRPMLVFTKNPGHLSNFIRKGEDCASVIRKGVIHALSGEGTIEGIPRVPMIVFGNSDGKGQVL